ncbi:hypothetical protein CQ13_27670 [Bradyrhizobium retamae]|uniref:Uncharacterized protein n=2 Tax=Bradyrhizobium retamae TaxID=1300035 RepID=A0A0R3MYY5_9BRAD|nr:hypothetical protein CQ13_27670 [Bradyrhizobium retamae]
MLMQKNWFGGMAAIGIAGLAYWMFWPADPNARCSDSEVRDEVRVLIGGLTSAGKFLDRMLDPAWQPQQQPRPVGSNAYIPPPAKKIEKPDPREVKSLLHNYVVLAGNSVAVAYDRDLDRVTCRVTFKLNNDSLMDAAKRSEVYLPAATLAATQKMITAIGALAQQDRATSATYTVQPGDRFGRVMITVEPLGPGPS